MDHTGYGGNLVSKGLGAYRSQKFVPKFKMTQRYAHLINGALRKAVNVVDEVF